MGAFLDKPKIEKRNETGMGNGLHYGVASMQGWRVEMEDAHCAVAQLPGDLSEWSFFAVFDGHAGARVSEHCATELLKAIVQTDEFKRIDPELAPSLEEIQHGIRDGFLRLDEQMRQIPEFESGEDKSGSTAVCVLVSPKHIFFANCGDSRGVLLRDNQVAFHTEDHKPGNPTEKERIQNAGGSVMIQRVNGSLAVSRALGDYDYKKVEGKGPTEQLVSPEPEITVVERCTSKDQLVVLACDGVWDVMTNDDVAEFVLHRISVKDDLSNVCNEIIDTCLYKGSRDNMSVVLVTFENAPKVDSEKRRLDQELEQMITTKVTEYIQSQTEFVDLNSVLLMLQALELPNLPPGGIAAKRHMVDKLYEEHAKENEHKNSNSSNYMEEEEEEEVAEPKST